MSSNHQVRSRGAARRPLLGLATGLLLVPLAAAQQRAAEPSFVVHEWGTFTSLSGSDGVVLEGLHHEEEALPAFVHDLAELAEVGVERRRGLKFPASRVTQKMETPVLYFHTDVPRRVTVDVGFAGGLITQFYPLPELLAPRLEQVREALAAGPLDLRGTPLSQVRWELDLIPAGTAGAPAAPRLDDADHPWRESRLVAAAMVRGRATAGGERVAEAERFVFYRGLGSFALSLVATTDDRGETTLSNVDAERDVPFAVAVQVAADGRGGAFRVLGEVAAGAAVRFAFAPGEAKHDRDDLRGGLGSALLRALVGAGLHQDEARAMVATWSQQWFLTPGRRVLWIVPRSAVEALLPLRIQPEPDALVRVLVGRMEVLTPRVEAAVERALRDCGSADPAVRAAARQTLDGLGRFLEPHLRRACARTESATVRARAAALLGELARG